MKLVSGRRARALSVGLSLLTAAVVLGGPVARAAHAGHATAAGPRRGGTVSYRFPFGGPCLDPLNLNSQTLLAPEVFDSLVEVNDRGQLAPSLALHWSYSDGGRAITFSIRPGVRFSNGARLTARSVAQNFDALRRLPGEEGVLGPLRRVQLVGGDRIRLVLAYPFRNLLQNLVGVGIVDVPAERKEGSRACFNPIGSGAFKVQSVGPGFSTVTLVRNPLHNWAPAWHHNHGPAYLSSVVVKVINSDATAVSELLSGGLDITQVPGPEIGRVRGTPNVKLHNSYEDALTLLGFNISHPPFNRPAVRRAVAEAINRQALINVAQNGLARPAYGPIASNDPFYDHKARKYAPRYDPAAARRVLAANHATGPYTLVAYDIPMFAVTAEFIQAELAQVGMTVNVVTKPLPDVQALWHQGAFDLNINLWFGNDLFSELDSSQSPARGGSNFSFYRNAALDRLLMQERDTVNPKRAARILDQTQRFVDRNVLIEPLFTSALTGATRARVKGWHTSLLRAPILFPVFQDLYVR